MPRQISKYGIRSGHVTSWPLKKRFCNGEPYLTSCQRIDYRTLIEARKLRKYGHKALNRNAHLGSSKLD
jgi:hypothetical protein